MNKFVRKRIKMKKYVVSINEHSKRGKLVKQLLRELNAK